MKILLRKLLLLVGAGVVIAGCSEGTIDEESEGGIPARTAEERVRGYWDSFATGDLRKAYDYIAADGVSYDEFVVREKPPGAGELLKWELMGIREVEGGKAEVELRLFYRMPFFEKPLGVEAKELWTLREGTWYRMPPERVGDPFMVPGDGG